MEERVEERVWRGGAGDLGMSLAHRGGKADYDRATLLCLTVYLALNDLSSVL